MGKEDKHNAGVLEPTHMLLGQVYAQGLLDALATPQQAHEAADELDALSQAWQESGASQLLGGPMLRSDERTALVRKIFSDRVSEGVEGLIMVLDRRGRLELLPAVARSLRKLLDKREGKIEVTLTTAQPIDEGLKQQVSSELTSSLKAGALLTCRVDSGLIGGAVLQIGDRVIDASVKTQLQKIRQRIIARRAQSLPGE